MAKEFTKRLVAPSKTSKYYYSDNIFYQSGFGMPNCFSGDTKIVTRDGVKSMLDCLGKEIEVLDVYGEWKKATVEYFGKNELIELEFADGYKVLTTPNHRWLVNKQSFYNGKKYSNLKEYETKDLKVSRNYNFPYNQRLYDDNVKYDVNGIIHGFVFGDGGYYNAGKQSKATVCGYKKEFMCEMLEKYAEHKCESNGVIEYYPFPKEYKELPSLDNSEEYLMGFIIGLLAADGTVDHSISLSNKSREVLEYIKEICSILKIRTGNIGESIVEKKKCRDRVYENYSMFRLNLSCSSMSCAMLLNPKHREKFMSTKRKGIAYTHLKAKTSTHIIDDVYCVVEPTTHTFTLENMVITRNCTAYAWGRWYELLGTKPKLCTRNAENWYAYTQDGYKRGKTPKLGAIAVWRKGVVGNADDGAGHVAVVEEVYSDGSFLTSNSAWGGSNFYTVKYSGNYNGSNGLVFLGFIYPPVEFVVKAASTSTSKKYKIGDTVKINGVYKSSTSTQKLVPAVTTGKITKIIAGANNPYLLNNGNIGWVNDSVITGKVTTSTATIKVGSKVKVVNPVDYDSGVKLNVSGTYDVIEVSGNRVVIGKGKAVTAAVHKNNLKLV